MVHPQPHGVPGVRDVVGMLCESRTHADVHRGVATPGAGVCAASAGAVQVVDGGVAELPDGQGERVVGDVVVGAVGDEMARLADGVAERLNGEQATDALVCPTW